METITTDNLSRLKASKANFEIKEKESGSAAGHEWAMNDAGYEDIHRLMNIDLSGYYETGASDEMTLAEWVNLWMDDDFFPDDEKMVFPSKPYVEAFVSAATAVFKKL